MILKPVTADIRLFPVFPLLQYYVILPTSSNFKTSRPTSRQLAKNKISSHLTSEQEEPSDGFSDDAVFEANES